MLHVVVVHVLNVANISVNVAVPDVSLLTHVIL